MAESTLEHKFQIYDNVHYAEGGDLKKGEIKEIRFRKTQSTEENKVEYLVIPEHAANKLAGKHRREDNIMLAE
jgi:hypothetical protein